MSDQERLAKLEMWKDGHEDRCKERYTAVARELSEIKELLSDGFKDAKAAAIRIHERIDGENQAIGGRIDAANSKLGSHKIWLLTNIIGVMAAILAWLADKLLGKVPS